MHVRGDLAKLTTITLMTAGLLTASAHAVELKNVHQQAMDMGFGDDMLREIATIFPPSIGKGVGRIESSVMAKPMAAKKSSSTASGTTRNVRVYSTRQVASAVTDDAGYGTSSRGITSGPRLFDEETRELQDRMGRDISRRLQGKGYDVQAVTARMENLTSVKIVLLASTASFQSYSVANNLREVRNTIEQDVLRVGYPNVTMTKASTFTLVATEGTTISEVSAMSYELDAAGFNPRIRSRELRIPTFAVEPAPAPAVSARRPSRPRSPARAPSAVSIKLKEMAEQSREPNRAEPSPVADQAEEKAKDQTLMMSEDDFQD